MATYVNDTYTGTDGTLLQAHTPEIGGTLSKHSASTSDAQLGGNRAFGSGGTGLYTYATTPGTDAQTTGVFVLSSDTNSGAAAIGLRTDTSVATGAFLRYSTVTDTWDIYQLISGTLTSLGTLSQAMSTSTPVTATFTAQGNQLSAIIGAQPLGPFTTTVTTAGKASVRLTGTNSQTTGTSLSSVLVEDVPVLVPTNSSPPVVSGSRVVGYSLSCTQGTWSGTPTSYAYQWRRDNVDITGATGSTYSPVTADIGTHVGCAVTASNGSGASTPVASNGLLIVAGMVGNDIQWLAGNLGGAPGAVITDPRAVFDDILNSEGIAGDVEYRLLYIKNNHPVQTLLSALAWISAQTTSPDTDIKIGAATEPAGTNVAAIPNEQSAPPTVTFGFPSSNGAGFDLGNIGPGLFKGLWVSRTVTPSAAATGTDACTIALQGTPA